MIKRVATADDMLTEFEGGAAAKYQLPREVVILCLSSCIVLQEVVEGKNDLRVLKAANQSSGNSLLPGVNGGCLSPHSRLA